MMRWSGGGEPPTCSVEVERKSQRSGGPQEITWTPLSVLRPPCTDQRPGREMIDLDKPKGKTDKFTNAKSPPN